MAVSLASLRPSAPIMRQYIQLIGSTAALPSGAADTAPTPCDLMQARSSLCCAHFARRSVRSTLPLASHAVTTTSMPAICALAGLVPCAEEGIRQMLRCASPRLACHALMASKPAYSPCDPALGC